MNHTDAVQTMLKELLDNNFIQDVSDIKGIGHRVLHGGEYYSESVLIDDVVLDNIKSSISRIIKNEKYVGDLLGQKYYVVDPLSHKRCLNYGEKEQYYVKDHHEGIIDRETWNKAQEILNKRNNNKKENGREHKTTYSLKYDFSSKIVCGHCNSTYVRRQGTKRKDGTAPIYWKCFQQVDEKRYCEDSKFIRDDVLKNMFIELYNHIVDNKHKTKEKLLEAIKGTLKDENYQN